MSNKNTLKASDLLEVEWFHVISKKKYFINTSSDILLVESNSFTTKEQAQAIINLWDAAPELLEAAQQMYDFISTRTEIDNLIDGATQKGEIDMHRIYKIIQKAKHETR